MASPSNGHGLAPVMASAEAARAEAARALAARAEAAWAPANTAGSAEAAGGSAEAAPLLSPALVAPPAPPAAPGAGPPAGAGAVTLDPELPELPRTATLLPLADTGVPAGADTWLPPPDDPWPDVVPPAPLPPDPGAVDREPELLESPTTAMLLPLADTGVPAGADTWFPPPVDEPPVVVPDEPAEPAEPAEPVDEPLVDELPSTAAELPPAVTGVFVGATAWFPPPVDEPPVVEPDEPAGDAAGAAEPAEPVDEPLVDELPSTATELPPAVTGVLAGADTWFPPPVDEPPVVEPDEPAGAAAGAAEPAEPVDEPPLDELPRTAAELPPAVTGVLAGADTWFPPPVDEPPVVELDEPAGAAAGAAEPPEPVEPVDEPLLDELPSTATELPLAVTGVLVGAVAWFPPPFDPVPLVMEPDPPAGAALGEPVVEPVLWELPPTATEFPDAATGAEATVPAWLPPRALCVPVVFSAAEACPA